MATLNPYTFELEPPDGKPRAVMDWPPDGSPVPRLTMSVANGEFVIRCNEAWRQLVLSTSELASRP